MNMETSLNSHKMLCNFQNAVETEETKANTIIKYIQNTCSFLLHSLLLELPKTTHNTIIYIVYVIMHTRNLFVRRMAFSF